MSIVVKRNKVICNIDFPLASTNVFILHGEQWNKFDAWRYCNKQYLLNLLMANVSKWEQKLNGNK